MFPQEDWSRFDAAVEEWNGDGARFMTLYEGRRAMIAQPAAAIEAAIEAAGGRFEYARGGRDRESRHWRIVFPA